METYAVIAIVLGFFLNNIIWMIFLNAQMKGKDFVEQMKEALPEIKLPSIKKQKKLEGVESATPQEADKILQNLVSKK